MPNCEGTTFYKQVIKYPRPCHWIFIQVNEILHGKCFGSWVERRHWCGNSGLGYILTMTCPRNKTFKKLLHLFILWISHRLINSNKTFQLHKKWANILVCVPYKTEPKTRTGEQMVYLGGSSIKQEWGNRKNEKNTIKRLHEWPCYHHE